MTAPASRRDLPRPSGAIAGAPLTVTLSSRERIWGGGELFLEQLRTQLDAAGHRVRLRVHDDSRLAARNHAGSFVARNRPIGRGSLVANDFRSLWVSLVLDGLRRRVFVVHGSWQVSPLRMLIARLGRVRVVAVSESVAGSIRTAGWVGNVPVLPLGPEQRGPAARSPDRHEDGLQVVTVARLDPVKRLVLFADAVDALNRSGVPAQGHVVTTQPETAGQETLLEALTARSRLIVHLDGDARDVLVHGDVFLSTSTAESLGVAHLEALDAGLGVVSTAVGGPREMLVGPLAAGVAVSDSPQDIATVLRGVVQAAGTDDYREAAAALLAGRGPGPCMQMMTAQLR